MSELVVRRVPVDASRSVKQVIVQVPFNQIECYEMRDYLTLESSEQIDWITPVQISKQYTGEPDTAYKFTIRRDQVKGATQWVDVILGDENVGLVAFGGPHSRIVIASNNPIVDDVTIAFLVQYKENHEDTINTGLLKQGCCLGTL